MDWRGERKNPNLCFVYDFNVSMIIEAVFDLLNYKIVDGLFKQKNPPWKDTAIIGECLE